MIKEGYIDMSERQRDRVLERKRVRGQEDSQRMRQQDIPRFNNTQMD